MCGASFGGRGIEGETRIPPERLSDADQLCEYVVDMANRGAAVATILRGALDLFSEELPAQIGAVVPPAQARVLLTVDSRVTQAQAADMGQRVRDRLGDDIAVCIVQANGAVLVP